MSSNKTAKQKLIQRYGKIDFLDQLKVTTPTGKTYKGKKLTYHHIKMKKDGGKATVENGALLSEENHIWFHKQPKEVQAKLNNAFQELKKKKDEMQELKVEFTELDTPFEISIIDFSIDTKGKLYSYNRAKVKENTRKLIQEELYNKE